MGRATAKAGMAINAANASSNTEVEIARDSMMFAPRTS
jgi:hypothetical protein